MIEKDYRRQLCLLLSLVLMLFSFTQSVAQQVWSPDNGNGTFTNPLMWGDWPDPDIIRVGDKFWVRARVTDKEFVAKFYYSTDGENFYVIGNELKMQLGLPWTANRFALFNYSKTNEGIGGYADFNWFRFTNK
ncbi:beta-xylosidase family glycoside hydrolase [Sphingobacterium lumbrici]|uniref:beta-xylosidase family glycoside hydrolase n=1 Tax=Sphingobacterium lumbrici TaxID=2559600 RepID=UPI001C119D05|nr:hypothetical protein [Sphingobacterium lumbrici]